MYHVYWKVNSNWEHLTNTSDLMRAKQWAIEHIDYSGNTVEKVEIRSEDGVSVIEVIYDT